MDRIYTVDELGDYLEHHGILGQRWGQLNGPPYPLTNSGHSSAQEAAAKAGVTVGKVLVKEALKILRENWIIFNSKENSYWSRYNCSFCIGSIWSYKLYKKVYGASNNNKVVNDFIDGFFQN